MADLGYEVSPRYDDERVDIVENVIFRDRQKLIDFCQMIQASSAVNSHVLPTPSAMPGYKDEIIMASGSFTQGSSIEISCDGPLREPYIAYFQGSLSYEYGKIAIMKVIEKMKEGDMHE